MIYEVELADSRTYICDKHKAIELLDVKPSAWNAAVKRSNGKKTLVFKTGTVVAYESIDVTDLHFNAERQTFAKETNAALSKRMTELHKVKSFGFGAKKEAAALR